MAVMMAFYHNPRFFFFILFLGYFFTDYERYIKFRKFVTVPPQKFLLTSKGLETSMFMPPTKENK